MMRSSFWTPTSSQGLVHQRTKLRLPNTVYFFHRVYSAQISACVIVPAADARMFVAERRNSHRQCGFGNPAQLSAGRNPRTVQKQRSLAPRMRRYLADRQGRPFLRIPSGHARSRGATRACRHTEWGISISRVIPKQTARDCRALDS